MSIESELLAAMETQRKQQLAREAYAAMRRGERPADMSGLPYQTTMLIHMRANELARRADPSLISRAVDADLSILTPEDWKSFV